MSARLRFLLIVLLVGILGSAEASAGAVPPDRLHRPGLAVNRHTTVLPHDLHAASWIVVDAGSGAVLAAQDAHHKYLPASTQKVLTALTLLPKLPDRRRIVTAVQADANVDGTRVGLVDRGRYSVGFLFSCMLMMSGNDCAEALARAAGGVQPTLAAMNAKARALGAHDTYAGTPSGLDARGQSSSAFDLAVIMRAALKIPDFVRYNSQENGVVPAQGKKYPAFAFANDNRLRAKGYAGLLAAKNGYTDAARHTYVCAARRGGRTMIVALMHAERDVVDTDDQAAQLMNWGFAVDGTIRPVGTINVAPAPRPHHFATATPRPTATAQPKHDHAAAADSGGGSSTWLYVLIPIVVIVIGGGLVVARRR
ncbi:MAG TPA: D-alanyl-D-alanine carboxypeptidase [Mycobacteriales bacterium]|nr:D-alanyl-D-alanine carboxypeptidase [Mycobacteriales bacterium]